MSQRKPTEGIYQVTVGNIGTVYVGNAAEEALNTYLEYVRQSASGEGRAAWESVILWQLGVPRRQYHGEAVRANEEEQR
jgi:hypothetical protein